MNKLQTFTSTGSKLLNHPLVVQKLKLTHFAIPISIQVAPESRCNLNCSFCSNTRRNKHETLDIDELTHFLLRMRNIGAKTVEITGGGDPTQYYKINNLITHCHSIMYKVGMITNGVQLRDKVTQHNLDKLAWLRISMNCLDYVGEVDLPRIQGTMGFSYVMNEKTDENVLNRLQEHVLQYKPAYVRIVPNCQSTYDEQEENNKKYSKIISEWGHPYFYQPKTFEQPKKCYWGYFKPFILHDGYVYYCSSIVLNDSAERKFHEKFRWCKMEDLPEKYKSQVIPMIPSSCTHCVFSQQNNIVGGLLNPNGMEDFV